MGFIFLYRPQYFLEDIELIIKNMLPNSLEGELNIGNINGNFITGFKVSDFNYTKDSTIVFSAKEIYIDPDLSRIAFGTIALSELILKSSYYNYEKFMAEKVKEREKSGFSFFNIEITSLIIDNGLIVVMDEMYNLNGELWVDINDGIELKIKSLQIDSPLFHDLLLLPSGDILINNNELAFTKITSNSSWLSGEANGKINIKDLHKSSGTVQIEKLSLSTIDSLWINIYNLEAEIDNSNSILSGYLKCDADFLNRNFTDIFISGIINKNLIEFDKASLIVDRQHISSTGLINILEKSWEVKTNIYEFELTKNTLISGEVNLNSDFNFDHFNGNLLLINSLIDSVEISSISGQFGYNNGILSSESISVESEGQIGDLNIYSFADMDNFNIYGKVNINDFSDNSTLEKYDLDSLSGYLNFNWIKKSDLNTIYVEINLNDGLLLENKFTAFSDTISGEIRNGQFVGKSSGVLNGWDYNSYYWDSLNFNVDL